MQAAKFDCDVLIVGYGPVGAVLAGLLGQAGVGTIVIDKERDVFPLPRAAHFDHETMRVYQHLGVADEVLRHAQSAPVYEFRAADGALLLSIDALSGRSPSGWSAGYMFYQPGVERAVRAKVASLPCVDVRDGQRFESFVAHADCVEASLSCAGASNTVRTRYVVACDGASSRVRELLDSTLHDFQFDEPWLVVDTLVRDAARMPKVNLQICDPARPTTCVLMGPGRHRWEFMLFPAETAEKALQDDFAAELLAKWECAPDVDIERKAVYRFHGLVAQAWRRGRVFLAGDAAHQMPPFAGQGMCSGIRDAANLAWKLTAVLKDGAVETLLDTYQSEREPHVRTFIALAIAMGRVVCTTDPVYAAARNASMLAAMRSGAPAIAPVGPPPFGAGSVTKASPAAGSFFMQPWSLDDRVTVRLDDVLGAGPWLISQTALPVFPGAWTLKTMCLADAEAAPFRAELAGWLSEHDVASVLVRPDRYVFGTGSAAELFAAYRECLMPDEPAAVCL